MNVWRVNASEQLYPARNDEVAQELVVDNAVVAIVTPYTSRQVTHIELSVKGAAVRYTLDGTDPASDGVGSILDLGIHIWPKEKVHLALFIESVAASDGVIRFEPLSG